MKWIVVAAFVVSVCQGQQPTAQRLQQLRAQALQQRQGIQAIQLWQEVLKIDPNHLEARVMMATTFLQHPSPEVQVRGITLLEACHNSSIVKPTLDMRFPQAVMLTSILGRYHTQQDNYGKAKKFTEIAYNASKAHTAGGDVCLEMQLASMLDLYPVSEEQADLVIQDQNDRMDALLRRTDLEVDENPLSDSIGPAEDDPYVHCLISNFQLSFYYRADVAALASKHYQIAIKGWPDLQWAAPHVVEYDRLPSRRPCENRKIRLGIISGVLVDNHSVTEDFAGVLQRLNRNIFDVTYVYVEEMAGQKIASFTKKHALDNVLELKKGETDTRPGAWVRRLGEEIGNLHLDMLLYLDLTMSTNVRRLGLMRLAPVQLNTHGHPVTSGISQDIVQYFVSWAEAELPYEEAELHYTEDLKLIPKGTIHQYYERRVLPGSVSRVDGGHFGHLTRRDFGLPEGVAIYMNMNKPAKLHPEYDRLVCGILQRDLEGHIVLHQASPADNQNLFEERLTRTGCDMRRIHFLPLQLHHQLLGLIQVSTVVLDSYPAGGCTTTREVLELGKAVVTLPARLLGGRWTLGYYNILNLDEHAKRALIAETEEEFIKLAVAMGKSRSLRESVEASIREAVPRLFRRTEAVREWESILEEVSPVQLCDSSSGGSEL